MIIHSLFSALTSSSHPPAYLDLGWCYWQRPHDLGSSPQSLTVHIFQYLEWFLPSGSSPAQCAGEHHAPLTHNPTPEYHLYGTPLPPALLWPLTLSCSENGSLLKKMSKECDDECCYFCWIFCQEKFARTPYQHGVCFLVCEFVNLPYWRPRWEGIFYFLFHDKTCIGVPNYHQRMLENEQSLLSLQMTCPDPIWLSLASCRNVDFFYCLLF